MTAARLVTPERCGAERRWDPDWNSTWIPCVLEAGHDGEHFSTSGCAGSEMRWVTPEPGPTAQDMFSAGPDGAQRQYVEDNEADWLTDDEQTGVFKALIRTTERMKGRAISGPTIYEVFGAIFEDRGLAVTPEPLAERVAALIAEWEAEDADEWHYLFNPHVDRAIESAKYAVIEDLRALLIPSTPEEER